MSETTDSDFGNFEIPCEVLWKIPPGNCLTLNSIWEMARRREEGIVIDEVEIYLTNNLGKKFRNPNNPVEIAILERGVKQNLDFRPLPPSEVKKYDRESLYYRYRVLEES